MGLMSFIKKQFIDIIQWTEDADGTLAWRFPMAEMEIQNGAQLVVRESQMALFVNERKVADVLGPGTHKLTSFRRETPSCIADSQREPLQEQPFSAAVTV